MGKDVIVAADGPGFLVNRCGRPFSAEGLRLLQERAATHEQIDRICRLGGGFRMGPFELMDLVGIDVGFEVAKSFTELSFGEPRWRPSPIQARMVAAGRLGRKSGRGYYDYVEGTPYRPDDPEPPEPGGGEGTTVSILGDGPLADGLRERARSAGFELREGGPTELVVDAGPAPAPLAPGRRSAARALRRHEPRRPRRAGGRRLPPAAAARGRAPGRADPAARDAALRRRGRRGVLLEARLPRRVGRGRARASCSGRIVCQLVNEAAFAIGEGVGSADDVDTGLTLGLSHPRGPVAWSEAIGLDHVLAVLDGLWEERREERYRAAPLLRRAALLGRSLRD